MLRLIHPASSLIFFAAIFLRLASTKFSAPDEDCETCRLHKEIEDLKSMLTNCEDELKLYKDSISNQNEVESSSALSYLGSFFYGITSPSKRSSPLHSTVNTFLQNLDIDEKKSINEINYIHEADVRYES